MTLGITVDIDEVQAGVDSLTEFLESVLEIRDCLVHLLDLPSRVAHVHRDGLTAAGAGETRLALQPTQGFLDLVTAVRAGNVQLRAIKEAVHRASPCHQGTLPGHDRMPTTRAIADAITQVSGRTVPGTPLDLLPSFSPAPEPEQEASA